MKTVLAASAIAAGVAFAAMGATAQNRAPGPSITLYDLPNYQGPSRTFSYGVNNLGDQGYNDRAQSVRVQGRWRLCEEAGMRGRCVDVSGDIANLNDLRMTGAVSSFDEAGRDPFNRDPRDQGRFNDPGIDRRTDERDDRGPFRPGNGAFSGPSLDGRTASFFPRPQPGPYRNAEDFCRRLGFAGVIYADTRGRDLRDVLCRR